MSERLVLCRPSGAKPGLTDGNAQARPNGDPGVVDGQGHAADSKQSILAVQLVAMAGGIDDFAFDDEHVFREIGIARRLLFQTRIKFGVVVGHDQVR